MTESEFRRDDREYELALNHREELGREDIILDAFASWRRAVTPRPPQPVVAAIDAIRDEWEAA